MTRHISYPGIDRVRDAARTHGWSIAPSVVAGSWVLRRNHVTIVVQSDRRGAIIGATIPKKILSPIDKVGQVIRELGR